MNNELYSGKNAKHFSQTRNQPWEGWKLAFEFLKELDELSVLDLGCGNGRYLDFLLGQNAKVGKYVGLDSSVALLEIAEEKYGDEVKRTPLTPLNQRGEFTYQRDDDSEKVSAVTPPGPLSSGGIGDVRFLEHDLDNKIDVEGKFNHVVLWAVLHHIEASDRRIEIIQEAINYLEKDGILAITFWQFGNNPEFLKKHTIKNLEDNNYILSFGKEKSERFCHHFPSEEIDSIINSLNGVKLLDRFNSDGFNNNMNCYVILQKI